MNSSKLSFIAFFFLIAFTCAQDLKVSEKCAIALTDENFKSVIESNEFVFVFFYSATCPACRRFDPIWEDTTCALQDKNIVFAHLEGNENQGVINAYGVTHTPTLALFHKDMSTPIKYRGQQTKEAMIYFLKSQAGYENPGSPAVHITTEEEAYRFSFWRGNVDNHLDPSLNGFFPSTSGKEYEEFTKAVINLDGLMRCGEIISDTIQEAYFLEPGKPAIVMYRDYDERKSVYEGEWDAKKIEEWARLYLHPSVGFADSQRLNQFFRKEGILVHVLVDKESIQDNWNDFQDFMFNEVAIPLIESKTLKRGEFTIVSSDGVENENWIKGTSLDTGKLPVALIIDFKTGYRYQPRNELNMDTIATDLIQFVNDYTLSMARPVRHIEEEEKEL